MRNAALAESITLSGECGGFSATVALFYAVIAQKRVIERACERQCACPARRKLHGEHAVGIRGEIFPLVSNAAAGVFHIGERPVKVKPAAVVCHIVMGKFQYHIAERAKPAASVAPVRAAQWRIAEAVFRYLNALSADPAENTRAEKAVSERQRPFFPARLGAVVLPRKVVVADSRRGLVIAQFQFRLICHGAVPFRWVLFADGGEKLFAL